MAEENTKKRTSRGGLWHALLVRKAVVLTALGVLFLSSASWLWDEIYSPLQRPKLIEALRWFPWYAWTIIALVILVVFIGEHAYTLIYAAEQETEETRAQIYDGRPLFVFQVTGQPQWKKSEPTGEYIFRLGNCGKRSARFVQMETQTSFNGKYFLRFQDIPVLSPEAHVPVGYAVNDEALYKAGKFLDQNMFWKFLHDVGDPEKDKANPLQRAVRIWFDIKITYRDMNDVMGEDVVRLNFDVDSENLFASEVPYTRNPPPEIKPLLPL